MSSTILTLFENILATLRDSGIFAQVLRSPASNGGPLPRAVIGLASVDYRVDDSSGETWCIPRWELNLMVQSQSAARLAELSAAAIEVLRSDPTCGGCCSDGPFGLAMELCQAKDSVDQKSTVQQKLNWLYRYRMVSGGVWPDPKVDDESLFNSGPNHLIPGSWTRAFLRREVGGLDGEFLLDMGKRSRTLIQKGQLRAANSGALNSLIIAIQNKQDGQLHSLADADGISYERVVLETFTPESAFISGPECYCNYTLVWRQLP